MARVRVHYDGWIALPTDIRRRLGASNGDKLEMEWVDGGMMLRMPGSATQKQAQAETPLPKPERASAKRTVKSAVKPRKGSGSAKLAGALLPKTAGRKAVSKRT